MYQLQPEPLREAGAPRARGAQHRDGRVDAGALRELLARVAHRVGEEEFLVASGEAVNLRSAAVGAYDTWQWTVGSCS